MSSPSPIPPSVMIQLSSLAPDFTPAELAGWMQQICPAGVSPAGDLVLQDVAGSDGSLLTSFLDVLVPYLPGASKNPCFFRVFVGTVEPTWSGSGSLYIEGVQDAAYVQEYIDESTAVANAFLGRYPQVKAGWYITYEANLNELCDPQVLAGYESLLTREVEVFTHLRPEDPVMWSPAFWYPYSVYSQNRLGMARLRSSLVQLFSVVSRVGGIAAVDLQDYVSGSECQPSYNRVTPSDAVGWVRFLESVSGAPKIYINVEQYSMDCATGGIVNGNPASVRSREAYYQSVGLTIGPSFELRYWIANHQPGREELR